MATVTLQEPPLHHSYGFGQRLIRKSKSRRMEVRCKTHICNSPKLRGMVKLFDPAKPIESAVTPPGCWYTDPGFLELEMHRVFYKGWRVVGFVGQVANSGDFFTGRLGAMQYVICKDKNGYLHAFHNICRHHASLVGFGSGNTSCFVCPYHAWTYGLDGKLLKATRLGGIQNFEDNGLLPISLATWGPFLLINLERRTMLSTKDNDNVVEDEWLGSSAEMLSNSCIDESLRHVARREYMVKCNWKVFCDNYLDGGYHVPIAHSGLAGGLDLKSYTTKLFEKVSIQTCQSVELETNTDFGRLGRNVAYAFVYPNFMINRYGPWMDTNLVLPMGVSESCIIFDYYIEPSYEGYKEFIEKSLLESDKVQMEDKFLCEAVQTGLASPAYQFGRYAPNVEMAMHHFHCALYRDLLEE